LEFFDGYLYEDIDDWSDELASIGKKVTVTAFSRGEKGERLK
jgi:hypothetical protein